MPDLPASGGLGKDGSGAAAGLGPVPLPVLQIHASLKCNLCCAHCYSQSGPSATGSIAREAICQLIEDAADMGYRAVAFSGGEPMIYPGLRDALRRARALGLKTSVTTNGTLLDPRHLDELHDLVTVLALSLDGPPELHNEIRGSPSAFQRLSDGVANLRSTGIAFGFIHTLTRQSWEHLPWLAEFAHANGATLFHIHPLEIFGRAERTMREKMPDEDILMRAYLLGVALLARYQGQMRIQIDLVHRDQVLHDPSRVYVTELDDMAREAAELLGTVVLEPDGSLVPLAYGFSRRFKICSILEERFASAWPRYAEAGYPAFRRLCRAALTALAAPTAPQLLNWHDHIFRQSLDWQEPELADKRAERFGS